jgi:hypothetical protein
MKLTLVKKLSRTPHYNLLSPAAGAVSLALLLSLGVSPAHGEDSANGKIHHVLLISLDGMHSLDMANFIKGHPQSALAQLAATGVNYTAASTTKPSDSFPSMVGIVTGGTPAVTGIYYDDAYNRALSPPGSNCTTVGTAIDLKEGIDINPAAPDGGGGIDPAKLPLDPKKGCSPVYPHNLLRVNTIFEVIRGSKGGYTAYSEKRPSYDILNGPSGTGVADLYTPEIAFNATISDLTKTKAFDELRVISILNEIGGKDHSGTKTAPVPTIFGMNFQSLNAAKKISGTSGYTDHIGTPDALLADGLDYVDSALQRMVDALRSARLLDSTAIIVTAKHGETPLDPPRTIVLTTVIPNLLNGALGAGAVLKATEKSNAIIWLKNQSNTLAAANLIDNNRASTGVGQIFALESLKLLFPDPLVDPAVPDIIVTPGPGINYEPTLASATKAEHGGLGENETHVPLIVSNTYLKPARIQAPVNLTQIAPTILDMLRYDPNSLDAVRLEGTPVLPNITLKLGQGGSGN